MAFALLILGAVLLVSAVRNTQATLFDLVKGDFTGQNNFIYWTISILVIGGLGYIPKLKALSVAFLALVVVVLILTKGDPRGFGGGFFQQFTKQIGQTQAQPATPATSTPNMLPPLLNIGPGVPYIQ